MKHIVRGHWATSKLGNKYWVPTHFANNPGRTASSPGARKARITITITVTAALAVGGISYEVAASASSGTSATSSADGSSAHRTISIETTSDVQKDLKTSEATILSHWGKIDGAIAYANDCFSHSYGQVQGFFKVHPCKWVVRAYLALDGSSTSNYPAVLIALSWVNIPNTSSALSYMNLADTWRTGNVTELSRDVGPYQNVTYSGRYYESGIDGDTVWNAEVQPVSPVSESSISTILTDIRQ